MKMKSVQETVRVKKIVWGGVGGRKRPKDGEEGSRKERRGGEDEWAYRHGMVSTFVMDLYGSGRFRYGNTAEVLCKPKHDAPSIWKTSVTQRILPLFPYSKTSMDGAIIIGTEQKSRRCATVDATVG
jgi:hypothetical protein